MNLRELKKPKITRCGEVLSLGFVQALSDLESLVFSGSHLIDGNLTVCEGIKYVYYNE
ncbi:hypothetical protein QTG56_01250 [Rossellomorea sp. AcN35-11]|nr:hypothetical protein [Rossellomorea aquimaris]WJV29824.1 hypothetical protein QTG56_01250 [Rossellomorea sp. AcN35-11]